MTGKIHWGQSKTLDNLLLLEGFAGDQRFYIQQFNHSTAIFVLTNLRKRTISGKNVEELKALAETWLELAASQPAQPVAHVDGQAAGVEKQT